MTGERPDDAHEPDQTVGPADGHDGLEARRASAPDAPFHGLRSAADIFGAPRGADEWPSRRERREAEKAARETGAPLPEPFEPVVSPSEPAFDEPAASPPSSNDDGATQAIPMREELTAPSENPQASAEHERETLGERIPAAAPVPPTSAAPHPSSISLPTAQAHRDQRAAENRAIEDERRRLDPFGEGRGDVDWLGRATGSQPAPTGPVVPPPLGVENVLPTTDEPPSFTELLRIADVEAAGTGGHERPFDWAIRDDETGEVPATLTTNAFDTTALAGGSWTLADESDDDVVSGELETPVTGTPVVDATSVEEPTPDVEPAPVADATGGAGAEPRLQDDTAADPADAATTALPVAGTPWWAEPEATVPPTAAPPLVEPVASEHDSPAYPAHLPPAVGQDLDAVMGIRGHEPVQHHDEPTPLPAAAPDDLDQSEWDGRETSDTSAIKDLFGTEAVGALGGTGYDPHDTGTRMMPAVGATPAHAPAPGRTPVAPVPPAAASGGGDRGNFINEGFAKLRNEGQRGKLLLIWGSIALIVILLVAVFGLTRWILGNTIEDHTPAPTSTSTAAASAKASSASSASAAPSAPSSSTSLQTLQFATTPAAPGEHSWTDLAGGECLSPFTNAWAQTYTVVDCATPHVAQLTARLQVSANQWPGPDALAAQAAEQCQTSAALDTAAAASYGDVQVQGSYAPDQATWDQGDVFISCFVTRSSGATMTGSVAPGA
ncbi:hypothetical protein FHW23_000997 [Curtobacterium pusillum]|uniref:Septum formation-related domain-containing protein n=1 Tax=Curtobacterium pusillum TaxID=69373 RepID=A0AAW3T492_9MICO|nr:septum formation family protein [Curtobacterium pusillum]MBA8989765.1 hypothetical protein [Curtobacterium pusillum]